MGILRHIALYRLRFCGFSWSGKLSKDLVAALGHRIIGLLFCGRFWQMAIQLHRSPAAKPYGGSRHTIPLASLTPSGNMGGSPVIIPNAEETEAHTTQSRIIAE